MNKKIRITIDRFDPSKAEPRHKTTYVVPFEQGMRVLTALEWIQENLDPSLAFRWNCRAGACGSCAVEVNGKAVLTCKHEIKEGQKIELAPMKAFEPVKDLVIDLTPMWAGYKDLKLWFEPKSKEPFLKITPEQYEAVKDQRKCIECFICHTSCHVIREHEGSFVGPRHVIKASALDRHPNSATNITQELDKHGLGLCNISRCCQENCPENINLTDNGLIYAKERVISKDSFMSRFLTKTPSLKRGLNLEHPKVPNKPRLLRRGKRKDFLITKIKRKIRGKNEK